MLPAIAEMTGTHHHSHCFLLRQISNFLSRLAYDHDPFDYLLSSQDYQHEPLAPKYILYIL
jgi:hypothetical protein